MRRLLVSVFVASGLVLIGAGTASAEQAPAAGAAQAAGKKICKITDERLGELSGLVATGDGFVVINDSSDQASRNRIFFLDDKCEVGRTVSYSGDGPRDTEDMALSPDGKTLWIADIGDNRKDRRTVGLWSMPADGEKKPKIHRLAYPAAKHDAEALLINGDGTPIIVTKEFGRAASIYTPAAPLKTDNTEGVALRKVGEVTVPASDTSANTLARIGRATIDGGAVSRDGSKVVLRTYTDALEFDVKNGDVVAALKGEPRVTPLPDEPFGEAISYSPDGKYLYTVSDMGESQDGENFILRYTPAAAVATTKADATGGTSGGDSGLSWFDELTINDITYIVGGVGVLGAILVGAGIFGIMRSRRRPPPSPGAKGDGPDGPKPADAETELLTVGGAAAGRGSGGYGGNRPAAGPAYGGPGKGAGVYGGQPGGRPGGAPAGGRPGAGQPGGGGRPGGGGHPAARPGAGGQPAGRPGGAPVGQPGRPGGQPGRPAGGQPARPAGGPAARPGGAGQPGRPGGAAEPARGGGGQPPGRAGGVQPGRPGGAQPGRAGGGRPVPPAGGQPPAGRPGAQPGGGAYGGGSPQPPARDSSAGGPGQRPSGFFGQGAGHPEPGRPAPSGMNYADTQGRSRNFDNPGYGRHPYGH